MTQELLANQGSTQTRFEQFKDTVQNAKEAMSSYVAIGAAAGAAALTGMGVAPPQAAEAQAPVAPLPEPSLTITAQFGSSQASAEDISSSRVTVLSNVKATGTPKGRVKRAERAGDCFNVGKGTKNPKFWNQGYSVDKKSKFGLDTRKSRVCEIGGKLIRVACNNEVRLLKNKPTNSIKGRVLFVRSFNSTKIKVTANAVAVATCTKGGANAYALGMGSAYGYVNARTLVRGSGKGKTVAEISGSASGEATAKAAAKVSCTDENAKLVITSPVQPEKPPTKPPAPTEPLPEETPPPTTTTPPPTTTTSPTKAPMTSCDPNIDVC
ncbi:MAG: hypothetical protein ACR2FM_05565 [Candidatus Saccharimonadales bacterium]